MEQLAAPWVFAHRLHVCIDDDFMMTRLQRSLQPDMFPLTRVAPITTWLHGLHIQWCCEYKRGKNSINLLQSLPTLRLIFRSKQVGHLGIFWVIVNPMSAVSVQFVTLVFLFTLLTIFFACTYYQIECKNSRRSTGIYGNSIFWLSMGVLPTDSWFAANHPIQRSERGF